MPTILVAILIVASGLAQQARPNFAGDWVLAQDRSSQTQKNVTVTTVAALLGEKFTATQTPKTLEFTISTPGLPAPVRAVYNLDGSESRNINPPDEPIFSTVSWVENKLVIKTRGTALVNGKPLETIRTIWIDSEGLLTIERSAEGQTTMRSVYRRSS